MITALDSSVLLDVVLEDPTHRDRSLAALRAAHSAGVLVVCPVVWSEVRAALREPKRINEHLGAAGIRFDPFDEECADLAGDLWRAYRTAGGRREHLVPDFLIGAHAQSPRRTDCWRATAASFVAGFPVWLWSIHRSPDSTPGNAGAPDATSDTLRTRCRSPKAAAAAGRIGGDAAPSAAPRAAA